MLSFVIFDSKNSLMEGNHADVVAWWWLPISDGFFPVLRECVDWTDTDAG